nr:hypothetical protein [Tanacetum cinerariifolium]
MTEEGDDTGQKLEAEAVDSTMDFTLLNVTYSLKGDESLRMIRISLHRMQALLETEDICGVYEFHSLPMVGEDDGTMIDGSYHFCVDYRALNAVTVRDKFPIPTADEMFDELGGAVIFTKLDLRAGYHQIRGISYRVTAWKRTPKKVTAVCEWLVPKSQRHVRGFLGLAGYYRRFIQGYATMVAPLTNLLRKDGFKWDVEKSAAFEALKRQLHVYNTDIITVDQGHCEKWGMKLTKEVAMSQLQHLQPRGEVGVVSRRIEMREVSRLSSKNWSRHRYPR